jgi:hypothetical protein
MINYRIKDTSYKFINKKKTPHLHMDGKIELTNYHLIIIIRFIFE